MKSFANFGASCFSPIWVPANGQSNLSLSTAHWLNTAIQNNKLCVNMAYALDFSIHHNQFNWEHMTGHPPYHNDYRLDQHHGNRLGAPRH